jgi:hypothetical protein
VPVAGRYGCFITGLLYLFLQKAMSGISSYCHAAVVRHAFAAQEEDEAADGIDILLILQARNPEESDLWVSTP